MEDFECKKAQVCTTLPPKVTGNTQGFLHFSIPSIVWTHSVDPPAKLLSVRFKWWGENGRGTVFRVPVVREGQSLTNLKDVQSFIVNTARYTICSSIDKVKEYLNDMPSLIFYIGVGRVSSKSLSIGQASVDNMRELEPVKELNGESPVVQQDGVVLGLMTHCCYLEVRDATNIEYKSTQGTVKNVKFALPQKLLSVQGSMSSTSCEDDTMMQGIDTNVHHPEHKAGGMVHVKERERGVGSAAGQKCSLYEGLMEKTESLRRALTKSLLQSEDVKEDMDMRGMLGGVAGTSTDPHSTGTRLNDIHGPLDPPPDLPDTNLECLDFLLGQEGNSLLDLVTGDRTAGPPPLEVNSHSDEDSDLDLTVTSDYSDHPLHNSAILDKLLYDSSVSHVCTSHPHPNTPSDAEDSVLPASTVVDMLEEETKQLLERDESDTSQSSNVSGYNTVQPEATELRQQPYQLRKGLGVQGESMEKTVLRTLGMDRLTWLGSVSCVRVEITTLELDQDTTVSLLHDVTTTDIEQSVFFVEYHFPLANEPAAQEVMRVASKKMKNGAVSFNHRSSFPVSFTSSVILSWWGESVLFRVYAKPPHHRTPLLLGKCSLRLQKLISSKLGREQYLLKITPASLPDAVTPTPYAHSSGPIGTLKVDTRLVCKGKMRPVPEPLLDTSRGSDVSRGTEELVTVTSNKIKAQDVCQSVVDPQPIQPAIPTLQLLLFIPDAVGVSLPSHNMEGVAPNCYIVCRMFCTGRPPPLTDITWNSSDPNFNFKLTFPIILSSSLLSNLRSGVLVVEVWHKTPGTTTEDMLIGLVKVSLNQFFLAYNYSGLWKSMAKLEYPVVGMDSYCPVVSPFTTGIHGHLGVLLAMGTSSQVTRLLQHYAGGRYILQRPYLAPIPARLEPPSQVEPGWKEVEDVVRGTDTSKQGTDPISHQLVLTIKSVKNLPELNSEIWGAADCFVQYHFPSQNMQMEGTSSRDTPFPFIPHRTPTIMCIADPVFNQEMVHSFTLPPTRPLQHVLLSACPSSGIPLQVWKRYYYPNIRDQLVAKGVLQLAKVCAVVTMKRASEPESRHSYTVPLSSTAKDSFRAADGVLELSVSYRCGGDSGEGESLAELPSSMVTLSFGVLRMCGLKDTAAAALEREPSLLAQPAQIGVNTFVRLKLPFSQDKLKGKMDTKPIAQSFCPEHSHHFDLSLPLASDHCKESFVRELMQKGGCTAVLEVWHKVLRSPQKTMVAEGVTARHLQLPPQEVLLGSAEVELSQLLRRETGIRGWVSLQTPTSLGGVQRVAGGVEVSVHFPSQHHRELVMREALDRGFSPPCVWTEVETVKVSLAIGQVTIAEECVGYAASLSTKKLCYLRYKVYDKKPVVTRVLRTSSVQRGVACYEFCHQSSGHVTNNEEFMWYLKEEQLEIQVWLSASSKLSEVRPSSADVLFGSCFVPLSDLLTADSVVKGRFALFKPGASTLGNGFVQLTMSLHRGTPSDIRKELHVTESDTEVSSECSPSGRTSSSSQHSTVVKKDKEFEKRLREANLFDCSVVIHQAAIGQDCPISGLAPSLYVTLHPHPLVERITTPTAPPTLRPVWNYRVETKIPREFLDPHFIGLEFQVWSKPSEGPEKLIGTSNIDLSPLVCGMPYLSGWYTVSDYTGHTAGHLNVTINPHEKFKSHTLPVSPPTSRDVSELVYSKTVSLLHSNLKENIDEMERVIGTFGSRLHPQTDHIHRETSSLDDRPEQDNRPTLSLACVQQLPKEPTTPRGSGVQSSGEKDQVVVEEDGSDEELDRGGDGELEDTATSTSDSTPSITPSESSSEESSDEEKLSDSSPQVQERQPHPPLSQQPVTEENTHSNVSQTETEVSGDLTPTDSDVSDGEHSSTQRPQEQPLEDTSLTTQEQTDMSSRLPNFFLPPHQLEENMRALRLSALSRPPPRELLDSHQQQVDKKNSGESSVLSTPEQLERHLEERLRSYRKGTKESLVTFDEEETRRIARIFKQYQH